MNVVVIFVLALIPTMANADDVSDVKTSWLKLNQAQNAGDVEVMSQFYYPERSLFDYAGRTLRVSEGFDKAAYKAAFDSGVKFNWNANHLDAKVYGNAAVVTGYHVGTITNADGSIAQGTRRFSEFWIKEGKSWKQVHRHASMLEPVPRGIIPPP